MTEAADARPRTVAVVLAGGSGTRLGHDEPKQLLRIAGRTMLEHSIAAFEACELVDDIVVVMTPGWENAARDLVTQAGFTKAQRVVSGGAHRSESTMRALTALGHEECFVLVHDAARPLVDDAIIRATIEGLTEANAVTAAIASADTLVEVADDTVVDIPSRDRLRRVQTPQAFRSSTLRRAYDLAASNGDFTATDDCSVVRRYLPEEPIRVVAGSERNIKVTHPDDVLLAELLLRR